MAGDREKTAGQAAKEKVERREGLEQAEEAAIDASEAAAEAQDGSGSATPPDEAESSAAQAKEKAAEGESAAAEQRAGDERDQRSAQERERNLAAGTIEPEGIKPTEEDRAKSPEELRDDVEVAREQLAVTVEELGRKIDPRPDIDEAKQRAREGVAQAGESAQRNATPIAAVVGALLGAGVLIWLLRRKR